VQQTGLVIGARFLRQCTYVDGSGGCRRWQDGQIWLEKIAFRQRLLAAKAAHFIDQWQQNQGIVCLPRLQTFQIIRQLQHGAHQHFTGALRIVDALLLQGDSQLLHFISSTGSAIQLDHLQRAVYLMQVHHTETHLGFIFKRCDERLQRQPRLIEG
jgi:hypothetical protein